LKDGGELLVTEKEKTAGFSWWDDDSHHAWDEQFLSYLIGVSELYGPEEVFYKKSGYDFAMTTNSSKTRFSEFHERRYRDTRRYEEFTAALRSLGVEVIVSGNNQFSWKIPDKSVRERVRAVIASRPRDWIAVAEEAIGLYGHIWEPVGINLAEELERCKRGTSKEQNKAAWTTWFRRSRLPALESDEFFLAGRNRSGTIRSEPPFSGYLP